MVTVSERPLNNSASIWVLVSSTRPTISGARTTAGAGAAGSTLFSPLQSRGRASSRSARKKGGRRGGSLVHPLNFSRANTVGGIQDGFLLGFGTAANGE